MVYKRHVSSDKA